MTCVHIVKDDTSGILGKKFGCDTLIFVSFTPLNMKENKMHFRHLLLFFYRKGKNATQRQTRYALFMAKVLYLKELCENDLLGLKLVILTLKIKNARIGPPSQMKIRLKH